MTPSTYHASTAAELIGPARIIGLNLERKIGRIIHTGQPLKLYFTGDPGCGKSNLAAILARQLAGHELGIHKINGGDVTTESVRQFRAEFNTASMFSDWRVLLIEEADKINAAAQVLMLTVLDDLPKFRAVLCTSNVTGAELIERFQTRFQMLPVGPPSPADICALIDRLTGGRVHNSAKIAAACNGNVRAALLDAESALDFLPPV